MPKTSNNSRFSRYKSYAKGLYYHIYNRGNGQQNIFQTKEDYLFYIKRLESNIKKHNIELICYTLMPNHIHLLAKQTTDVPIHRFMSSLHTSYSMYFNKKYARVGHLFQDRFKQVIVDNDSQLLYLTKYIHRNPVEAGITKQIADYPWTSYHEYMRILPWMLCQKDVVKGLLGSQDETFALHYNTFCNEGFSEKQFNYIKDSLPDQPF